MDVSLNFVDKAIAESISDTKEFKEFCSTMNQLEMILDSELYTEAVASTDKGSNLKRSLKNTKDSINAVGTAYSNTTDAGGNILNAAWRVVMASIKMVSRILKWAAKYVSKVPLLVADAIEEAIEIPSNIKNKIKGNIKLYITIEDLANIYSGHVGQGDYSIINRLNIIISTLDQLTKGELWSDFITKRSNIEEFFKQITNDEKNGYTKLKSDMKLIKQINSQFTYIKGIKFTQTTIDMNSPKIVDNYFGTTPILRFKDYTGKDRNETYLGAMKALSEFLDSHKEIIIELSESLNDKLVNSLNNNSFANLSKSNQKLVSTLFETISKTIEVIGNIIRYIITDIKTIEKERSQIKAAKTMGTDKKDDENE